MTLPARWIWPATSCRNGLNSDFDLAFSDELRIDHSITPARSSPCARRATCRSCRSTPTCSAPLPQPRRFVELGRTIRELVEKLAVGPARRDHRDRAPVARAGRPRQFGPHSHPGLRRKAVEWIATWNVCGCLAEGGALDSLYRQPAIPTHGFIDFMLMMEWPADIITDHVDALDLFGTVEASFT